MGKYFVVFKKCLPTGRVCQIKGPFQKRCDAIALRDKLKWETIGIRQAGVIGVKKLLSHWNLADRLLDRRGSKNTARAWARRWVRKNLPPGNDPKPAPRHRLCRLNLADKHFGFWEAEDRVPGSRSQWRCRCKCGTRQVISTAKLVYGRTRSCGCHGKKPKWWYT